MENRQMSSGNKLKILQLLVLSMVTIGAVGCGHLSCCGFPRFGGVCGGGACGAGACSTDGCGTEACGVGPVCGRLRGCGVGCCGLNGQLCDKCCFALTGWCWRRSNAIPQTLPLGSTLRAHDQVMQTNAEAADFIFHRHDFVTQTAHLTPDARDKVVEIASRMPSTPFPVIIERSANNSNPELDALRRNIVATILTDFGNQDAQQRTIVATPYGPGYTSRRAELMYYQHIGVGNNFNNNNGNGGTFGGGTVGGFGGGF